MGKILAWLDLWLGRALTWWTILAGIPAGWTLVEALAAGVNPHEAILFASAVFAFSMCGAYYTHQLFVACLTFVGARRERAMLFAILETRRDVGDVTISTRDLASLWHGGEGDQGVVDRYNWNTKFRRVKRAVARWRLAATPLGPINIESAIAFFRSHEPF